MPNILAKLNNKKKMWTTPKHPLYFENSEFKTVYGAAVFMQAALNKKVSTLNNLELERLLTKGFGMSGKEMAGVIKLAQKGQRIVDEVIELLDTSLKKELFLMDLYSVSIKKEEISKDEGQAIDIFAELLSINEMEKNLLYFFVQSALLTNTAQCLKIFEQMLKEKLELTMSELKYYIPELMYVTEIHNKIIKKGTSLRIVDYCDVKETIMVPAGTTLCISNATVNLSGSIVVDGGFLRISNSKVVNRSNHNEALILVKNFSNVELFDSTFDGRNMGSIIIQKNGNLKIEHCNFFNTSKESAVKFWGNKINLIDCQFQNCFSVDKGAALLIQNGNGIVKGCRFEDCEARDGGAVYTEAQMIFQECRFQRCRSLRHGAAIFYHGEVKSNVIGCEYSNCYPEGEELIQYIYEKGGRTINKEYMITVATILASPLYVEEMGLLNIEDALIYLDAPIYCRGVLNIKRAHIVAQEIKERDMFVIVDAKPCNAESSQFDGRLQAGVFRATNTRLYVKNSIFRNTNRGRAIYDAREPKISECIFSYCMGGAVNCYGGKIENSEFVGCRDKSGAGISIFGIRGFISGCHFVRCITEYKGAAIDRSGTHIVENCIYEECRPDNIS